jgi:hypothetical protein
VKGDEQTPQSTKRKGAAFWSEPPGNGIVSVYPSTGFVTHNNQISVVIEPGASLIHARLRALIDGLDQGEFTETHELDRKWRVPKAMIGRRLSQEEAKIPSCRVGKGIARRTVQMAAMFVRFRQRFAHRTQCRTH